MKTRIISLTLALASQTITGICAQDRGAPSAEKVKSIIDRMQTSVDRVKREVASGNDVSSVLPVLQQSKALFDQGKFDEGESQLQQAMKLIDKGFPKAKLQQMPVYTATEEQIDAFTTPELVTIDGYTEDCMEPQISEDGTYLFFNGSNAEGAETHIHFAKRVDQTHFRHIGILKGTSSEKKDMAPSIDHDGNFYFTSTRSFDTDGKSLYVGKFVADEVKNVHAVAGEIAPKQPFWIDMDCAISSNGKTLVISQARFSLGSTVPSESDLLIARITNSGFALDSQSKRLLFNVNTPALEYAPALADNELTLYFTRTSIQDNSGVPKCRIMVSKRASTKEPFGTAKVIRSIQGFTEAPSLTADGREMFFHKKIGMKNSIYHTYARRPKLSSG